MPSQTPKGLWRLVDILLDSSVFGAYTHIGYHFRRRFFDPEDIPEDLSGLDIMVTGANAGLGLATTKALARRGAHLIMACRNATRAEAARDAIIQEHSDANISIEIVDVSVLADVRRCCTRLKETHTKLDVLIHNAGVLLDERRHTQEGFELTFATNVLGPFLMTQELLPLLRAAPQGRVVQVTSGGMYTQRLDLKALQHPPEPFDGVVAYAQTKRAEVDLTQQWSMRLKDSKIIVNCMHPGWADTPGVTSSLPTFTKLLKPFLRSPEAGADTIIWLAAARSAVQHQGKLFLDRAPKPTQFLTRTNTPPERQQALWTCCTELIQSTLSKDEHTHQNERNITL